MKRGESVSWQAEELKKLVEMGRPEKRFRSWHAFPLRGIYQSYSIIIWFPSDFFIFHIVDFKGDWATGRPDITECDMHVGVCDGMDIF